MDLLNNNIFHYTESGLDNIYLASGVNTVNSEYGPGYSINDAEDLHKVICFIVATKPAELSAKEAKFLRVEADISQKELAAKLGVTDQTVSLWERGRQAIQKAQSLVLRTYALSKACGEVLAMDGLIEHIETTDFDESVWAHIILGWKLPKESDDDSHWAETQKQA